MGFLGIGTGEIILVLILALIILGPGKLPEIARTLGRTIRAIKKASSELTTAVSREMDATRDVPPAPPDGSGKAPSTVDSAVTQLKDDRPDKPGEAPAAK